MRAHLILAATFVLCMAIIAPIGSNFYKYYVTKNYDYLIEAECDPSSEICASRDCSNEECPPNGLDNYKSFYVKSYDFQKCTYNSCADECRNGLIECEPVPCDELVENCTTLPI